MSARSNASQQILDFLDANGLCNVYGGDNGYGPGKKYRYVLFDKPATLDGEVRVYGPKFIQVLSAGPLGDGEGNDQVFESVENTIEYIKARWVDLDSEAAAAVPRKPEKGQG